MVKKITAADPETGFNPQVIHNVDKKVTYRNSAKAGLVAKRRKNT
jgi:hypothetical protein